MAAKKQLTAAQGMDAACILFELNSKREHIVNLAFGAEIPEACLTEPGALPDFCAEWRAFVHATVTAGLMQHAPNSVLVGYLRRTGELLAATAKAECLRGRPLCRLHALAGAGKAAPVPRALLPPPGL